MNRSLNKPNSALLPVMEHFYTIQGEGFHQGRAAYFIRLAGCDVGCTWCDVKESWDAEKHQLIQIDEIISAVKQTPAKLIVITGGEPFMHDLNDLTKALKEYDYEINIETSGAYSPSGSFDWVCLSPKKFKAPVAEVIALANELKIIVFNMTDFTWAEKYASVVPDNCRLYLQPEWNKSAEITPQIIEYIKNHPEWELSLQIHKYINVP